MPFYTKVNSNLRDSNIFVKPSGSEILKEAKNVWVKNTNNVLKPIWNYWWTLGNWGACSASCGGGTQTRTVTCTRTNNVVKSDSFCSDITKPSTSQACNTQSCNIQLYSACDDVAIVWPADPNGNIVGTSFNLHDGRHDQTYSPELWTFPAIPIYNNNYYFVCELSDVGNNRRGNCGISVLNLNKVSCQLIKTLSGSWGYHPNGFSASGWNHTGPWWRNVSYGTQTIKGFFYVPAV